MSDIIQGDKRKMLENLFSWSQFYSNSKLEVNRWPTELLMCKWNKESFKIDRYYPFNITINNNKKQADKVQQQIIKISNK
jgi:hypothetical protein